MTELVGGRIKIARARSHIEELRGAARDYLAASPFRIERKDESNDRVYRVRVVSPVPTCWGAIVGDAIHNIRSSLDLLACALVGRAGSTPTRRTRFPIASDAASFKERLPRDLKGASPRARAFVRRLRPYSGAGNNVHLARVHALDIIDKHRVLIISGAAHKSIVMKFEMEVPWQHAPVEFPPFALIPADRQFPLQDGAELFRVAAAMRGDMAMDEPGFTFELAFGEPGELSGLPLLETLVAATDHIERVLSIAEERLL